MQKNFGIAAIVYACIAIVAAGCHDKSTGRFVPPSASAKQALESALTAWKDGKPMGRVDGTPLIDPVDSHWQAGKKIVRYEIAGEDTNAEGHRRFSVKLTMQTGGVVDAKYVVLGQNPISVYREEDYLKLTGQ